MIEIQELTNPFPGLRSFEPSESDLFFGREKQIDELLRKLRANRFLAIVGNSGSGKSSLVKCGLLPRLENGFAALAGSKWRIAITRPGNDPLGNLSWQLAQRGVFTDAERMEPNYPAGIEQTLRSGSLGLIKAFNRSAVGKGENLLLVIDQFEELFKFQQLEKLENRDTNDAFSFVNLILNATRQKDVPIYIVITMRSDFLGETTEFRGLPEAINDGQFLIPRMKRSELRRAITGPLESQSVSISSSLLTRLLNDMGDNPDQLPILQHVLMRMWDHWHALEDPEVALSHEHYEAIGTMSGALSKHANLAYNDLETDEQRNICAKIFKALTDRGEDNRGTRRAASLRQLSLICETAQADIIDVVEVFHRPGRSFLSAPPLDEIDGDGMVNISHESLMRVWGKLRTWVDQESESAEVYKRLAEASALFYQNEAGYWRDPELQIGLNWYAENNPNTHWAERYNPNYETAIAFLMESKEVNDRDTSLAEQERRQKLARARWIARMSALVGAFMLVMALVSLYFFQSAQKQSRLAKLKEIDAYKAQYDARLSEADAVYNSYLADESSKEADLQKTKALLALGEANRQATIAARNAEEARLATIEAEENAEEARLATIDAEENARAAGLARDSAEIARREAVQNAEKALMLSLLSSSQSIAVKALQIENPSIKALLARQAHNIHEQNGGQDYDTYIHEGLYEALKGLKGEGFNNIKCLAGSGHAGPVRKIAFTQNQQYFITLSSDGKVLFWDFRQDEQTPLTIASDGSLYRQMALSNDNKWLVCAGDRPTVDLFDLADLSKPPRTFVGHNGQEVTAVTFLPNSQAFITAGEDNSIQYNNLDTFRLLTNVPYPVRTMAISDNGRYLATGDASGAVRLWDLSRGGNARVLNTEVSAGIGSLKFDPKGNRLAIGMDNGVLVLMDLANNTSKRYEGHTARISAIDYTSNGDKLVTGSFDRTARMWDLSQIEKSTYQPMVLRDHRGWVMSVAFFDKFESRQQVITGTGNGDLKRWKLDTKEYADAVCEELPRNMTFEEWDKFIGTDNLEYQYTCPGLPIGDLYEGEK
ncbi:MAG: hypothetical protein AAF598_06820 [Bacteroidota bacterium]